MKSDGKATVGTNHDIAKQTINFRFRSIDRGNEP